MGMRIGIDLGGTSVKIGLVNENYEIVRRTALPTNVDKSFKAVMDVIERGVREVTDGVSEKIDGAGMGVPTTVLDGSIAVHTPNLGWYNCDVGADLRRRFDFPCLVANDADCAAMAENLTGAGRGKDSMVMITLGTGVGSAVVKGGRILLGARGASMEIGHMKIVADGELCGCGGRGCFEAYCSATAIIRELRRAAAGERPTALKALVAAEGERLGARVLFDAARGGDAVAQELLEKYVHYLAVGLSNITDCFRPEIIVIGGGVCAAGDILFEPLRRELPLLTYGAELVGTPEVVPAMLGNDAGIIGAAYIR